MTKQIILTLKPEASFLLGGVTFNPAYDSVTALDNGLPYLTPTAIKGSLRMELEAFARGIEHFDLCDLEEDFRGCKKEKCISCSLFGGGDKEGKLRFHAAVINDPESPLLKAPQIVRKEILEKGKREGVSISRELGKARDQSYYSYLTYPDMKDVMPIAFEATIDIREPLTADETEFLELFFAFLSRSGIFMGARKSVGLGHFKIEYRLVQADTQPLNLSTSGRELKLFRVKLKTLEPLVVGHIKNLYITDTLPYLPAPAIGGAIGFALTGHGIPGEVVETLFIENRSLSPFNFYYQETGPEAKDQKAGPKSLYNPPYPLPASMRRKKGAESITGDTLLQDYIIKKAIAAGQFPKVKKELFEPLYRNNLRPVPVCEKPDTSYLTRVAIGRELQKTKKEMLYSMEVINKGSEFHGLVIGEAWIENALKEIKSLYIGGKRSRGFGHTRIESIEEVGIAELLNPGTSIDQKLRDIADTYGIAVPADRVFHTLDLLADIGNPGDNPGEAYSFETTLQTRLFPGLELTVEKAFPLLARCGGYGGPSTKEKQEKPLMEKIMAGSTFLVSVPTEKAAEFKDKIKQSITESTQYNWDSTPLFRLNNPEHLKICEYGG